MIVKRMLALGLLVTVLLTAPCAPQAVAQRYTGVTAVYAANRKDGIPNYVTQDLLLVAYQDLSRQELRHRERAIEERLTGWLAALSEAANADPPGHAVAKSLVEVLAALAGVAPASSPRALEELALIHAAEGLRPSPLWRTRTDYSQFIPRGRYTKDESAERYFRLLRYLNSTLFHVNPSRATAVTADTVALHMRIVRQLLTWGAGGSGYRDLIAAAAVHGREDDFSLLDARLAGEDGDLAAYLRQRAEREDRYPKVLQGYVERTALAEGETAAQALLGIRLLPGTVTADTLAMQTLVTDTGAWRGEGERPFSAASGALGVVKGWPTADEVLVAMGSTALAPTVTAAGDDAFEHYRAAMDTAIAGFNDSPAREAAEWALLSAVVQSRKDISSGAETARALWTLQRHDNLLYAKQSYTPAERSLGALSDRSRSTVEAAPRVFAALAELIALRAASAPAGFAERWQTLAALVEECRALASILAANGALSTAQGNWLADIDLALKAAGIAADAPVVVDVHTHPGEGQALQQATGWPLLATLNKTRGARLSHHEFKQPLSERLTDEAWRQRLRSAPHIE